MPNLTDLATVRELCRRHGFALSKGFGQNFIINPTVCPRMVEAAGIDRGFGVLEIGPGIGVLTKEAALRAAKVVTVEVDQRLPALLAETLAEFDNVKIVLADVLKTDLAALIQQEFAGLRVAVIANLPYYITSPILLQLLNSPVAWAGITVMMQKEVAERLAAKPGTKDYGSLTLAIEYRMDAKLAFTVSRRSFVPAPNVDSAIVNLTPRKAALATQPASEKQLFALIRTCFAHRRKSLWNNLKPYFKKDEEKKAAATAVLEKLALDPQIRPERLTLDQFIQLANAMGEAGLF